MIPQIDNSLSDVIKQNKIPNRTYKIVSDTELKTVLGEPTILTGSSIEIKDNAYSELDIPKVYGKSVQATRSGKNLLKGLSVPLDNNEYWISTTPPYFTPLEDGWGKFEYDNTNGTSTIFINAKVKKSAVDLKENTTYTIVTEIRNSNVSESSGAFLQLITNNPSVASTENKSIGYSLINSGGTYKAVFTTKSDFSGIDISIDTYLRLSTGTKGTVEARISLVEGDIDITDFEYEPYGVMPSPEFPSGIQSVGDDVNLFDINTIYPNVFISGNGQEDASSVTNSSDYISVSANNSYVLSYDYLSLQHTNDRRYVLYDENKNIISAVNYNPVDKNISFKTSQKGYVRFAYDKNCYNIKLQKGTVATAYSEYGKGSVGIKLRGKNLAKPLFEANFVTDYIPVKKGEAYIYSESGIGTTSFFYFYETIGGTGTYTYVDANVSWTATKDGYIRINKSTSSKSEIMIEKGTIITEYEPYFQNNYVIPLTTPLRSLPNGVKDTIEADGIHRRVGSVVLDGSEGFNYSNFEGLFWVGINNLGISYKSEYGLSNYFKNIPSTYIITNSSANNHLNDGEFSFRTGETKDRIYFKHLASGTDVNNFKTWLSQNPITVDYELAEEVIEPFEEFKNIQNIETLNKRIIYLDTISEVNPDIDAKYYSVENVSYEQEEVSRIMGFVDNLEAIKQSAYHILGVERYSSDIYDFNYGVELEQYIGQSLEYIEATIQDTLQEALTHDERILGVEVTEITQTSLDCVYIKFNLICYLDEIEMEVYINV